MNKFILALFQRKHKLKSTTLFQVLIGRRTTSVLSYAYFNDLLPLFGSFPKLTEATFDQILRELSQEGWIDAIPGEPKYYQLLKQEPVLNYPTFHQLDYFRFGKKEKEVWRLIQFIVQVASYLGKEKDYLPIESSPYHLARTRYFVQQHKEHLQARIYEELVVLFQLLSKEQAELLSHTLTGYQQNGAAFFQLLSEEYQEFPLEKLAISNSIHAFLAKLEEKKDFLLYQFVAEILLENQNKSAVLSRTLFQQGLDLEEIGQQRRLKSGTLHDHFIEWAISDDQFPFQAFLNPKHQTIFNQLPKASWNQPYKTLGLPKELSFFELRLYQIQEKRGRKCSNKH